MEDYRKKLKIRVYNTYNINEEMKDIMKIAKSLENLGLLMKQFQLEEKNEKQDFSCMLLGTLGTSLLGNTSAGKGIKRAVCDNKGEQQTNCVNSTFCPQGYFGLGVLARQEILTKFIKILKYIKFLCIIVVAQRANILNI